MNNIFGLIGISAIDFVDVSAAFTLAMASFFGLKKHRWIAGALIGIAALKDLLIIFARPGLEVRFFAGAMLISMLVVVSLVSLKKRVLSKT